MRSKLTGGSSRFWGLFGNVRWSDGRQVAYRLDPAGLALQRLSLALFLGSLAVWAIGGSLLLGTLVLAASFILGMAAQWRLRRVARALEQADAVPERSSDTGSLAARFLERAASMCDSQEQKQLARIGRIRESNMYFKVKNLKIMKHERAAKSCRDTADYFRDIAERYK